MNALLLAILPLLTPGNVGEVEIMSNKQPVNIIFTMDGCGPCEVIKREYDSRPNIYVLNQTRNPMLFNKLTKGNVRRFPMLGVWHNGRIKFYSNIRKVLR